MQLKNVLSPKTQAPPTPQLVVYIGVSTVRAAVWHMEGRQAVIDHVGSLETVDTDTADDLLTAIDASISSASVGVKPEPTQVLYCLPETWVESGGLPARREKQLEMINKALEVTARGFVLSSEVITQYLEKIEGSSLSKVLVGLADRSVTVTVVQQGRVLDTKTVGRADDVVMDLKEALARFDKRVTTLPSSFLLYDGYDDTSSEQEALLTASAQAELSLLHVPKVTTLSSEELLSAIVTVVGSELPALVSDKESKPEPDLDAPARYEFIPMTPSLATATPDSEEGEPIEETALNQDQFSTDEPEETRPVTSALRRGVIFLAVMLVPLMVAAAVLLGLFVFVASVEIKVLPVRSNLTVPITLRLDPTGTEEDALPVRIDTETVFAEASAQATGSKVVGERAMGKITIFNRTTSQKSFPKGTTVTYQNLVYELNEDVSIASASTKENPDLSVTTAPATAEVTIVARAIGTEYNQSAGIEFTVANFAKTSYVARATTDLTGGTSREVVVVAASDVVEARTEALRSLEAALQASKGQGSSDIVVSLPVDSQDSQETLSAKAGEEADSLTLSIQQQRRLARIQATDLAQVLEASSASTQVVASLTSFAYDPDTVEVEDEVITVSGILTGQADPGISTESLANALVGVSSANAVAKLSLITPISSLQATWKPAWMSVFKRFPFRTSQMTIEVVDEL